MANPVIGKHRVPLDTGTGPSFFYLDATNVDRGDGVLVVKSDGSDGYWSGTVTVVTGYSARCKVRFFSGPPPAPFSKKKRHKGKPFAPGDLILVDITITNDTNPAEQDTITEIPAAVDP